MTDRSNSDHAPAPTPHLGTTEEGWVIERQYNAALTKALVAAFGPTGMGAHDVGFHYGTFPYIVKKLGSLDAAVKYVVDGSRAFANELNISPCWYSIQVMTHGQFEQYLIAHASHNVPLGEAFWGKKLGGGLLNEQEVLDYKAADKAAREKGNAYYEKWLAANPRGTTQLTEVPE